MRLDRNSNPDGKGKYALIKLRNLTPFAFGRIVAGLVNRSEAIPVAPDAVDLGDTPDSEFFVIRLKDKYAANALQAYAVSCSKDDPEFSRDVRQLAMKARQFQNKQSPT
jgi:hypothetical protein